MDSGQKIGHWPVDKKLDIGQWTKNSGQKNWTMDSAQKIGHWKVVDSRHWTLDSIENEQKIGQSPADSNWTVSVGKKTENAKKINHKNIVNIDCK